MADFFYRKKICFGKFPFWKENNAFETFFFLKKTLIPHVSLEIFGFISNAIKAVFKTSRSAAKQTSRLSKSSRPRRSLGVLRTAQPGGTQPPFCHFGGKPGTFLAHRVCCAHANNRCTDHKALSVAGYWKKATQPDAPGWCRRRKPSLAGTAGLRASSLESHVKQRQRGVPLSLTHIHLCHMPPVPA